MVRKKHAAPDIKLSLKKALPRPGAEALGFNARAEKWLARIKSRLPDDGTAVVTMHRLRDGKFLVSFRANAFGETFISEAKGATVDRGLEAAGSHLLERLALTPPGSTPKTIPERMREFFE